jgi:hypothetical protein
MNNFFDLLDTDYHLDIECNGVLSRAGLHDVLQFSSTDTVFIDGMEILPKYWHLCKNYKLIIDEPFYCWYHRISGQGWLLRPS